MLPSISRRPGSTGVFRRCWPHGLDHVLAHAAHFSDRPATELRKLPERDLDAPPLVGVRAPVAMQRIGAERMLERFGSPPSLATGCRTMLDPSGLAFVRPGASWRSPTGRGDAWPAGQSLGSILGSRRAGRSFPSRLVRVELPTVGSCGRRPLTNGSDTPHMVATARGRSGGLPARDRTDGGGPLLGAARGCTRPVPASGQSS